MAKIIRLKTWPDYFQEMKYGRKPFEIRKNDRDYAVGDFLVLDEWDPDTRRYTSEKPLVRLVRYVMPGGRFGLAMDCVALGVDSLAHDLVIDTILEVAPTRPDRVPLPPIGTGEGSKHD